MTRPGLVALFAVTVLAGSSARASVLTVRKAAGASLATGATATDDEYAVPHDLLIGAGVSAIQTEGAWNEGGQVGVCSQITYALPNSTRPEDVFAAETFNQFQSGSILHPVVYGDYPEVVKKFAQNLTPFSDAEKQLIQGTTDFIGFNVYYSTVASYKQPDYSKPAEAGEPGTVGMEFLPFVDAGMDSISPSGPFSQIAPEAIRSAMLWAWESYNLPLLVTENGFGDSENLGKQDHKRAVYYSAYLRMLVKTAKDFGIKVMGYCAWSLIDSFEWSAGFSRPYGLVHVDYEHGTLDRSLKDSSSFWITLAETGVVPLVESIDSSTTSKPPASSSPSPSSSGGAPTACFLLMAMATAACLL